MSAITQVTGLPSQARYYLHSAISLIIMFGFGSLPPITPLTPLGMNLVGIFLGVLYGWIFIEIVWPSLAGLLAMMLCRHKTKHASFWLCGVFALLLQLAVAWGIVLLNG